VEGVKAAKRVVGPTCPAAGQVGVWLRVSGDARAFTKSAFFEGWLYVHPDEIEEGFQVGVSPVLALLFSSFSYLV
jgi:hypothetical protein